MPFPLHLHGVLFEQRWQVLFVIISVTIGAAIFAAVMRKLSPSHANDPHLAAIQASHTRAAPRIGGIAMLAGIIAMMIFVPQPVHHKLLLFFTGMMPIVLAGLAEDLGRAVSPKGRLLAAALSAAIVVYLLQRWLPRSGLPYVDDLLSFTPLAIAITILGVTALTHAFNLIDGLNGLALGVGFSAAVSMAYIADMAGDEVLCDVITLFAMIMIGLILLNFPWGKIFLGDAGAYGMGFCLSLFAIILIARNASVSPVALVLVFFFPIADLILTIWRRSIRRVPVMAPDHMHIHQVAMRIIELAWLGKERRQISNPLATVLLVPFFIAPMVAGYWLWNDTSSSLVALTIFSLLFALTYIASVKKCWMLAKLRRAVLRDKAIKRGNKVEEPELVC